MRIAQAAQQVGISTTTLKRLEKRGLIHPRKDRNGQRRYTDRDIATDPGALLPRSAGRHRRGPRRCRPPRMTGGAAGPGRPGSHPGPRGSRGLTPPRSSAAPRD